MLGADALCIPLMMYLALALKDGRWLVPTAATGQAMLAAMVASIPVLARIGLYRAVIRYMGPRAALVVAAGSAISVLILLALAAVGIVTGLPASTTFIFGSLLLVYLGASRMLLRWLLLANSNGAPRVLIYGAGAGGAELAAALATSGDFAPVAFVDDNRALWGTVIGGLKVHSPDGLASLLKDSGSHRVLLAMPSLTSRRRREILAQLVPLGVHVQTMPGIADLVTGAARVDELQEIAVTDLLGRDPVAPVQHLFESCIKGKTVLVTGGGGSIGSELCRQILRLAPRRLVLLEMSELALYNIDRELRAHRDARAPAGRHRRARRQRAPQVPHARDHAELRGADGLSRGRLQARADRRAQRHRGALQQRLRHLACGRGGPRVQRSRPSCWCRPTRRSIPTNVMGATKRFAEVVLQGLQQRGVSTRFCMVRFGNVLESSGSVVPLFRDQIRRGGPVTVTHPDVIRYFMTIPEAAQLVIQAGSMARGGDVFVLDMGKPIRIVDLARRMIQLAGLAIRDAEHPDGDIEIVFTGLRPAEKLFEELLIGKDVAGTEHPMIMRAVEHALPWQEVQTLLDELGLAMRQFDCRTAHEILQRAVAEYRPTSDLQDLVWSRRAELGRPAPADAKVTDLQTRRAGKLLPPPAGVSEA